MSEFLDALKSSYRNVVIIGTCPISDDEYWPEVTQYLLQKLDTGDIRCNVIAESDNQLFQLSLRTDSSNIIPQSSRITFTQLKFRRDFVHRNLINTDNRKSNSKYEISSLNLPIYIISFDDNIWYLPAFASSIKLDMFKKVSQGDVWYESIREYTTKLINKEQDGRFSAKPDEEMLELFDQDQIPRGIFPRDCFYDTDHYQFVVWDFVFSRKGELLIHKRSENAKDNQGMWDKTVGGHSDFNKERSSSDAATRELIEELYTKEKKHQTGREFSLLSEDISKVYYLGEWRLDGRGAEFLDIIKTLDNGAKPQEEPWVFYKLSGTISHNTPRILPDNGGEKRLRVLVDVFIYISNTVLTREYAKSQLTNSEFMLIEPSMLKTWIENGVDDRGDEFKVTPDLEYIMAGKLRDRIDEVAQLIKYSDIKK